MNKYKAKSQTIDGIKFGSIVEANRYCILKLMQKSGEISGLTPHPRFSLIVNGTLVGHYTADASYFLQTRVEKRTVSTRVVEEVKGYRVRDYALRVNLFRTLFPDIEFVEIGTPKKRRKAKLGDWIPRKLKVA